MIVMCNSLLDGTDVNSLDHWKLMAELIAIILQAIIVHKALYCIIILRFLRQIVVHIAECAVVVTM